jgi:predicted carbohydrate-binding protein with CBM5 and CBM33 domain
MSIKLALTWEQFKIIAISKGLELQYLDQDVSYYVYALDNGAEYETDVVKTDPKSDAQLDFENNFKNAANARISFSTKIESGDGTKLRANVNSNKELLVHDIDSLVSLNNIVTNLGGQTTTANPIQFSEIQTINHSRPKSKATIKIGSRALILDVPVPVGKTWFLTAWDGSGTGNGFFELSVVDRANAITTVIESFDSITGWTTGGHASSVSLDTSNKTQGTGAGKVVLNLSGSGLVTDARISKTYSPTQDWSAYDTLSIDAKGTRDNTALSLKVYQGSSNYQFAAQAVSTIYGTLSFDLTEIIAFDLTAISKIEVWFPELADYRQNVTVYVDNFRGRAGSVEEIIDYFFTGSYVPHQHLFPTNIKVAGENKELLIRVTNNAAADQDFEVGLNGREV